MKRNIWHPIQHKKLQIRLFISYLQLILSIVILFSFFFFKYTSKVLVDRETANIVSLASNLQIQTDQVVRAMDNVSINIGYSNLVMDNLEEYFSQTQHDWSQTKRLADLFVALNGTQIQVEQTNIYNLDGEVVGFGKSNIKTTTKLSEKSWYLPTMDRNGFKYLTSPYSTDSLSKTTRYSSYYISLYRTYYNRFGKQVGIIETMQACKTIFKAIIATEKTNPNSPKIYVFNENNQLIYPYDSTTSDNMLIPTYYIDQLGNANDHVSVKNPDNGQKELVAFVRSPYTGWTLMMVQSELIILAPVYQMSLMLIGVVVLLLFVATLLSLSMSLRLSRPIRELRMIMCNTELDTLGDQQETPLKDGYAEVEALNSAFYMLSNKLKKSKDAMVYAQQQEMKARSVALQAQINPHFYFNSLTSIIVLAKKGMNESIIKLGQSLSHIMRYVTNVRSSNVTIQEEIEYISQYLYCMKVRYQSSLEYDINIDPTMNEEMIPKLLIQPLVENALKYGTNCHPPWTLQVNGYRHDSGWIIEVLDSGPGFTKNALEAIQINMQQIDNEQALPALELGGMGLNNVYARWKLFSGPESFFRCSNREEGGARVQIGRTGGTKK